MRAVEYEHAFMFAYSLREKTHAHRNYDDDVPHETKLRRLQEVIPINLHPPTAHTDAALEVIQTFHECAKPKVQAETGKEHLVLVEGTSKRNMEHLSGRTDTNRRVIFHQHSLSGDYASASPQNGDFVKVRIEDGTTTTLQGTLLGPSSIAAFARGE